MTTAIPGYDANTTLTASGQTHAGGAGATMGLVVGMRWGGVPTNFASVSWGGIAMTNVYNYAPSAGICIWQYVGDAVGSKVIAWTGSPVFSIIKAVTLTRAAGSKNYNGAYTNSYTTQSLDVATDDWTQLVVAFACSDDGNDSAGGAGNVAMWTGANSIGLYDPDGANPNQMRVNVSATTGIRIAGMAITRPLGGSQVIWF